LLVALWISESSSFPLQDGGALETFGGILSSAQLQPLTENTIFSLSSADPGCMTYFWFTAAFEGLSLARIRYYIDDEPVASIDFEYFLGHGIGFGDESSPWGNQYIGKGSTNGAVYNTYRIPFGYSVTITAEMPGNVTDEQVFWFVTRGVYGMKPQIGNFILPSNTRLRTYRNENVTLQPLEFLNLTDAQGKGMLMQTTLAVSSANQNYLEGCFRAYTNHNRTMFLLSSGTEDYFQSAFYFYNAPNNPRFYFPGAGLTHMEGIQLSAYKIHIDDPVFFQGGLRVVWRNGDTIDPATGQKCINDEGTVVGSPQVSQVWTYAWVYEW